MDAVICQLPGTIRRLSQVAERTYFEKDVLRVGEWHDSVAGPWLVTEDILNEIAGSFQLCLSRGVKIPVQYGHGGAIDDATTKIGNVEDVWRDGDTLYCRFWAGKDSDARHLSQAQPEVSGAFISNWKDGSGNKYAIAMVHVAVVSHPVCNGQGEFRQLSLAATTQRRFAMAEEDTMPGGNGESAEPAAGDEGEIAVDPAIVDAVAERFGLTKPSGITIDTLKEFLLWIGEGDAAEEVPAADEAVDMMPVESMPMSLKNSVIRKLREKVASTARELSLHREKTRKSAKEDFTHALNLSIDAGKLTEAGKQSLLQAADACDYNPVVVRQLSLSVGANVPANGEGRRDLALKQGNNATPGDPNVPARDACLAMAAKMRGK